MIEEHLLSLIIQSKDSPNTLSQALSIVEIDDFNTPPVKKIIEQLHRFFKKHDELNIKSFSRILTQELTPTFDRCFMTNIDSLLSKQQVFTKELKKAAREIKKLSLRRRASILSTKIGKREKTGKEKVVKKLKEELRILLIKLGEIEKA